MVLLALYRVTSDVFYRLRRKLADMADAEFEPMSGALKTDLLSVLKLLLSRLVKLLFFFRLRHKGGAVSPDVVSCFTGQQGVAAPDIFRRLPMSTAAPWKAFSRMPVQT